MLWQQRGLPGKAIGFKTLALALLEVASEAKFWTYVPSLAPGMVVLAVSAGCKVLESDGALYG